VKVITDLRIQNFWKRNKGRGDNPIGVLEGWNAGIMGLDFYFGLQIADCKIESSKSLPAGRQAQPEI
jgi:hypothetical protein